MTGIDDRAFDYVEVCKENSNKKQKKLSALCALFVIFVVKKRNLRLKNHCV
jgi:hypothetical protein